MRQASDAAVDHVRRFDGWLKHIEEHEQAQSDIFDGDARPMTTMGPASVDADIRRSMADFSVIGMAKDALGEAKKVAVDGLKTAPAEFLPKLGIEATKESTKFHDWEDKAKDGGGWRTWRDLRTEEEEKQEEKRKEANGG